VKCSKKIENRKLFLDFSIVFFIFVKENLIYLKKTVRVDQLKFNKSCTSFIGDLKKKERKNTKTFAKYSTSYTKNKFVIKKKKKKKIIFYKLDVKLLILFDVNRIK